MDGDWSSFGVSQAPDACSVSGEYFRAQTLTCESCPSGEAVTADGLGCACVGNTIRTSVDPAGTLPSSPYGVCMSCATESKVASWDRTTCMACDATAGATFDADQDDCVCGDPATQIVVELDAAGVRLANGKACQTCPTDTFPHPTENGVCFSCPSYGWPNNTVATAYDAATGTCLCPSGVATQGCFDPSSNAAKLTSEYSVNLGTSANMLSYYDLGASLDSVTVESLHLATNMVTAAAECRNYGNRTQCEHVANLCVLTMYDTGAAACKLHAGLRASHPDLTPRLFYDAGVDYAGMNDLELEVSKSASGDAATGNTVQNLEFVVSITSLTGEWLGFKSMGKLFQLCGGRESELDAWTRFGTNYHNDCVLSVEDALEAARGFGKSTGGETLFFDVFIQDLGGAAASSNAWPERLYPVPVYVREAPDNDNAFVNDDFFVRRFFVIDETVGVKTAGEAPLAVTYARTVELTTAMTSSDNKRIAVPKLSVSYASRDPSFEYVVTDAVSFRATYTSWGSPARYSASRRCTGATA